MQFPVFSAPDPTTEHTSRPLLLLSMGDVNGIGPEILAKALARPEIAACCTPVVVGSAQALEAMRRLAPACPPPAAVQRIEEARALALEGHTPVLEAGIAAPPVSPGKLDAGAGAAAVAWIREAVRLVLDGAAAGIVTCPVSKEAMALAGERHLGHTGLIAEMCGVEEYRMCLFAGPLRVVHITGHLPLREALDAVRPDCIMTSIHIGAQALQRLGMGAPRIAVAGLNPHAGEAGLLGSEEEEHIAPAIAVCAAEGILCTGPHPPDTVFRRMAMGEFDMVIAMYHDQGHIPMKLVAMDEGVNVTLGLPIVRTSVDHGTAFDIAGQGVAREDSLIAAATLAAKFAASRELA